ncbi:MAG TPA: M20/M25/M40 family metallo-hydrolase, partial [Rhizomicrobium sp.]
MRMIRGSIGLVAVLLTSSAMAQTSKPVAQDEAQFRTIYKEMVETNSSASGGGCTKVGEQVAARMKAAGFPDDQVVLFTPPGHPKEGGLVVLYPGTDPKAKAIMLLAHEDVVEAKREDWTRDPYKLYEENGYFMARGAFDDKAQAAIWADMLIDFKKAGYKPRHTIKMALTCGEEGGQFNGARWLAENKRDLIDAAFALNEGGRGQLDD